MKAILVIDIPDGINVEECLVDYEVYHNFSDADYEEIKSEEIVNLRPLPKKKPTMFSRASAKSLLATTDSLVNTGYNLCIDEILGEQKNG